MGWFFLKIALGAALAGFFLAAGAYLFFRLIVWIEMD